MREHFKQHAVVHLSWTIGALVAIVILLATLRLGSDDSVKDILNFSVALASLVLAVVAIVQALVSGGALTDAVSNVNSALVGIQRPAAQLEDAATVIRRYSENIGLHATDLKEMMGNYALPAVEGSTVNLGRTYSAEEVLPNLNESARLAFYVVLRSFETGKPVSFESIGDEAHPMWSYGFVIALISLSLIGSESRIDGFAITDLGPFAWLPERRGELTVSVHADGSAFLLSMIAAVERHYRDS